MFHTIVNTPLGQLLEVVGGFRKPVTAKVNIADQVLRESAENLQLPVNRSSTLFPGHPLCLTIN